MSLDETTQQGHFGGFALTCHCVTASCKVSNMPPAKMPCRKRYAFVGEVSEKVAKQSVWDIVSFSLLTTKPSPSSSPFPGVQHQHAAKGFSRGMERLQDHPSGNVTEYGEAPHCLSSTSAPTSATSQSKQNKESRTNTAPFPTGVYPGPLRASSRVKYHPCPTFTPSLSPTYSSGYDWEHGAHQPSAWHLSDGICAACLPLPVSPLSPYLCRMLAGSPPKTNLQY